MIYSHNKNILSGLSSPILEPYDSNIDDDDW